MYITFKVWNQIQYLTEACTLTSDINAAGNFKKMFDQPCVGGSFYLCIENKYLSDVNGSPQMIIPEANGYKQRFICRHNKLYAFHPACIISAVAFGYWNSQAMFTVFPGIYFSEIAFVNDDNSNDIMSSTLIDAHGMEINFE